MKKSGVAGWLPAVLLVAATLLLALAGFHVVSDAAQTWDYSVIRLQRSFVLAAGEPIYPGRDEGPILNAIYGPVGAVAYLPATLATTPATAVTVGQVLSLVFVLLPPAVILWRATERRRRMLSVLGVLLFAAVTLDLRPLEYIATTIHVDAPGLALALVAWTIFTGLRPSDGGRIDATGWAAAALWAALAVWTKLMLLPLLVAMPLWALLTGGWRRALRASVVLALALGVVTAAVVELFGPADRLFFNVWTVPSSHTVPQVTDFSELLRGTGRLLREGSTAWALWLIVGVARLVRGADWRREPACVYGFLGLLLAPFSVFGLLKLGGDVNALGFSTYFVLVGAVASLVAEARDSALARRSLVVLPALVAAIVVFIQEPEALTSWRTQSDASLPHQVAYEYALEHPGEVYFPRITLASLLAEGRIYHQSVGLLDRQLAGASPSKEHLWAHLPENLQAIALAENGFERDIKLVGLPEFDHQTREPELPGFVVYRRGTAAVPSEPTYSAATLQEAELAVDTGTIAQ